MQTVNSKFWIGLGLGSVLGFVMYRFSCTSKARRLKAKARQALRKMGEKADGMVDSAKEKVMDAGKNVADKVADETFTMAEKADDVKNKVHNYADAMKK